MDFSWTADQLELKKRVIEFAKTELHHSILENDKACVFPRDSWKKCAEYGILGTNVPQAYGGSGRDVMTSVLVMEALGYGCRDNGFTLGLNAQLWTIQEPILTFGSEDQKRTLLPRLCKGELIAGDAITEERAGSDALNVQTTAEKVSGGYCLNGSKRYIGFAPIADMFLVFARTDPSAGTWGISCLLVDANSEGLQRSANHEKMGLRTLPMGSLEFKDCFVPESDRLGPEGIGMSLFNHTIDWERSFILASHVGAMARQLDLAIEHARSREQFGKRIAEFQSVSNRIADMKLRLETCQLLLYKAAWMMDNGHKADLHSTIANLHISESFLQSSLDAMRVHGGKGYLTEYEIERDLRDSAGGVLYAGTSDIQRNLIARHLGL